MSSKYPNGQSSCERVNFLRLFLRTRKLHLAGVATFYVWEVTCGLIALDLQAGSKQSPPPREKTPACLTTLLLGRFEFGVQLPNKPVRASSYGRNFRIKIRCRMSG